MRLLIDVLVAIMVAGILVGVAWQQRADRAAENRIREAHTSVQYLHKQIQLQAAVGKVPLNERGLPMTVDPLWFEARVPDNPLIGEAHPWLEVATPDQKDFPHPHERVALDKTLAKFWYNPWTGVIRARVGSGTSDATALQLYNQINDCELTSIFDDEDRKK